MGRYLLRRLAYLIPVWLGISFVAFALANLTPGDPARLMLQRDLGRQPTGEEVAIAREALGLNDRGDIVGDDPGGGWLWTESAGRQDFAVGIGGFRPRAINAGGVLAGNTDLSATESRAAVWRNGQLTVLAGRGTSSGATAVSANTARATRRDERRAGMGCGLLGDAQGPLCHRRPPGRGGR